MPLAPHMARTGKPLQPKKLHKVIIKAAQGVIQSRDTTSSIRRQERPHDHTSRFQKKKKNLLLRQASVWLSCHTPICTLAQESCTPCGPLRFPLFTLIEQIIQRLSLSRGHTLSNPDLRLQRVDGIIGFHVYSDGFPCQCFHEDLHDERSPPPEPELANARAAVTAMDDSA